MKELSSVYSWPTPSKKNNQKFLIALRLMGGSKLNREACERLGTTSVRVENELNREACERLGTTSVRVENELKRERKNERARLSSDG